MTEEQTVEATPATPTEGSQAPAPTAEQVEAEYKARLSGKDKAHAAEVAALREQIASLSGTAQTATQTAEGSLSEADALKKRLAEVEKTYQQREQDWSAQLRATKFPYAAEALEPQVLATMDEAKLAGLNARLTPSRPGAGIDPSTPPRDTSSPKPIEQKTVAELRADLERMSPDFAAELRG